MKKIRWWEPVIGEKEYSLIEKVLKDNFPNEGPLATQFEERIAELLGVKHAVAVSNGTSAIFLSLKALGIGPGDEVVVPDLTFIATANAVEMTGARPVLADIEPKRLSLDPESFEAAITKRTKAVIPVAVTGRAPDMRALQKVAGDIHIVEDAAEAFMSKHKGRFLGTYGIAGCFSFSPHKTITTGQGGMIITDDDRIHKRLRELKDQGRPKRGTGGDDIHDVIGYNFKFTDLQAAVGLGQLDYLHDRIARMRRNYSLYSKHLAGVKGIDVYRFEDDEVPQWTDVRLEKRNELSEYLEKHDIDSRRFWFPLHRQKPYRLPDKGFDNTVRVSEQSLWMPSAFTLTDEDIKRVCDHIKEFLK